MATTTNAARQPSWKYFLILVFTLFCATVGKTVEAGIDFQLTSERSRTTMDKILVSLNKAVHFYLQNIEKVNLDSVFGLRVCQGGLNKAIVESKLDKEHKFFTEIVNIHSKVVNLAEEGFLKIKSTGESSYFQKFEHLINGKWFAVMPYHSADKSLVSKVTVKEDESFSESASDQCMAGLLGSQTDGLQKACEVTKECWHLMTREGTGGYYLTHQGLFLLLADKRGCRDTIIQLAGGYEEWQHKVKTIGANIYHQMMQTYQNGQTKDSEIGKDLFIEQVVVCQMLGVVQCFDIRLLNVALELQDVSGCWKQDDSSKDHLDNDNPGLEFKNLPKDEVEEDNMLVKFKQRRLQEDVVLDDGCSTHFTGVATGCLGMFAYWFASHPDTLVTLAEQTWSQVGDQPGAADVKKKEPGAADVEKKDFNIKEQLVVLISWAAIFVSAAFVYYIFRKWRRNLGPVLRNFDRLNRV